MAEGAIFSCSPLLGFRSGLWLTTYTHSQMAPPVLWRVSGHFLLWRGEALAPVPSVLDQVFIRFRAYRYIPPFLSASSRSRALVLPLKTRPWEDVGTAMLRCRDDAGSVMSCAWLSRASWVFSFILRRSLNLPPLPLIPKQFMDDCS